MFFIYNLVYYLNIKNTLYFLRYMKSNLQPDEKKILEIGFFISLINKFFEQISNHNNLPFINPRQPFRIYINTSKNDLTNILSGFFP